MINIMRENDLPPTGDMINIMTAHNRPPIDDIVNNVTVIIISGK